MMGDYSNQDMPSVTKKLFVGGIAPAVHEHTLYQYFSGFGPVSRVEIPLHKESGIRKGYAFVTFKSQNSSQQALIFRRHFLMDHEVSVKPALKPQVACAQTKDLQTRKIYAFNFNKDTSPRTVVAEFSKFGEVHSFLNPKGGLKKRGFCYVIMQDRYAFDALTRAGSLWIDGALIKVQAATPLKEVVPNYSTGPAQYHPPPVRNQVSKPIPHLLLFSPTNIIRVLNEHPSNYRFRTNLLPVRYKRLRVEAQGGAERRLNPLLRVADQLSNGHSSTGQSGQNSRGPNSRDSSNRRHPDATKPVSRFSHFRSSNSREFDNQRDPQKNHPKSKFNSGAAVQKGPDSAEEEHSLNHQVSNPSNEESA